MLYRESFVDHHELNHLLHEWGAKVCIPRLLLSTC